MTFELGSASPNNGVGSRKTLSTLVEAERYAQLKMFLLARNIPINTWIDEQIKNTLESTAPKTPISNNEIPPHHSAPLEKKNWLIKNIDNANSILNIKSGSEEWLHLIKLWNRGELLD